MSKRTRKRVPWAGWSKLAPSAKERTQMKHTCGNKCFLGPNKSFPICTKHTCKIHPKGVYAAYIRARAYRKTPKYKRIALTAKKMLRN